jgi:RNA polymerase sigma-70 factor (ECF subfamily)
MRGGDLVLGDGGGGGGGDNGGDHQQLDALVRTHWSFLCQRARRLCGSAADAEDLLQDVLERTVRHFSSLSSNHRAWMTRVMRNLFIDRVRRRATTPAHEPADEAGLPKPEDEDPAWWARLDADVVRARIRELPEELRQPIELFAVEGYPYGEISQRLGLSPVTVGTRILRARRRLKQLLLDDPAAADPAAADLAAALAPPAQPSRLSAPTPAPRRRPLSPRRAPAAAARSPRRTRGSLDPRRSGPCGPCSGSKTAPSG